MKYEVRRACGHVEEKQLYGSAEQREKTLRWLENEVCTACAAKAREEADVRAAAENAAAGLPSLAGTPRQIQWAESIRRDKLAMLRSMPEAKTESGRAAIAECIAWYESLTDAGDWIDLRNADVLQLARICAERRKKV